MKRMLAAVALVAFLPTAHAQDKSKSEISHDAEFRVRDTFFQNSTGSSKVSPGDLNGIEQRFKLGLGFKANEKLSATLTLINQATWGQMNGETVGLQSNPQAGGLAATEDNFMSVNQAFMNLQATDDVTVKIGRMNFGFGDGTVMAVNDWDATPDSFDGATVTYEMDAGRLTGFGFKHRELTSTAWVGAGPVGNSASGDPEQNSYGLVFDLKTMPDWLKSLNVHLIKNNSDALAAAAPSAPTVQDINMGKDEMLYGLTAGFGFNIINVTADYNVESGKATWIDSAGATYGQKTSFDVEANMMQLKVDADLSNFMGSHAFAVYHVDSGDSEAQSATNKKFKTYDGYFHDSHGANGMMDMIGWGNLTYMGLGYTIKPQDPCTFGIAYYKFTRTEKDTATKAAAATNAGANGGNLGNSDGLKDDIGSEIDVWAEHKYENGLSVMAMVGQFMPGAYLTSPVATAANGGVKHSDTTTEILIQGKATF